MALEYLAQLPLAYEHKDFIMSFRENIAGTNSLQSDPASRPIFGAVVPFPQVRK